jgi:hypothetical protein
MVASAASSSTDGSTSTEAQLRALVARGFRFVDPRDDEGEIVAVVGVRAHRDVIDVVRLNSEDDAVAVRMPSDQDVMSPCLVFWREAGPAQVVLGAMLALPDDGLPGLLVNTA